MDLVEALRTTGAAREFTSEPVDHSTVAAILDDARYAPSGGNRQGWRVVVVESGINRDRIRDLIRPVWNDYVHSRLAGSVGFNPYLPQPTTPAPEAASDFVESLTHAPVVLAICADMRTLSFMDVDLDRPGIAGGASLYPFCWSILLSARARGLGGVLTTFLARAEPEAKALLHLPDHIAIAAMIVLGHPVKQPTRLKRDPVESFATIDTFDGASLRPANIDGPPADTERALLLEYLDSYRAAVLDKVSGVSAEQLHQRFVRSASTIGSVLKHLAGVEDTWFTERLLGEPIPEPWASAPWDDDADWEFHSAADNSLDELTTLYTTACERSRAAVGRVASLDTTIKQPNSRGEHASLRSVLIHMIEETARHLGHIDILRELADGTTGESR